MNAVRIAGGSLIVLYLVAYAVVTLRLRYWQWRVRRAIAERDDLDNR